MSLGLPYFNNKQLIWVRINSLIKLKMSPSHKKTLRGGLAIET